MKSPGRIWGMYPLAICIFLFTNGCGKSEVNKNYDCDAQDKKIDKAKADFSANQTPANCEAVVTAYNSYIDNGCDGDGSYQNLLDAFKSTNCK